MKIYKDGQIKRIKINKIKGKKYKKWANWDKKVSTVKSK